MLQASLQNVFDHTSGYLENLEEEPVATTLDAHTLRPKLNCEVLVLIHTAHYPHVLQVCRRFLRQPEDAEDAAAEVFLKLHAVLEKKNEEDPFRPWVYQVAGRHCIDKLRRRKREKCLNVAGNDLCALQDAATPSPLSQILQEEARRQVRQQLRRLPDNYRVPLLLRYYKRMLRGVPELQLVPPTVQWKRPTTKHLHFEASQGGVCETALITLRYCNGSYMDIAWAAQMPSCPRQ